MKYYSDEKTKKKLLKLWLSDNKTYKRKRIIFIVLATIGVAIFLWISIPFCVTSFPLSDFDSRLGAFAMIGSGFIFGFIPFAMGQSILITASYDNEYAKMDRETISIFDEGIEFAYHPTENEYRMSDDGYDLRKLIEKDKKMNVYRIATEEINEVNYNSKYGLLTIIGIGSLTAYTDSFSNKIIEKESQRRFYKDSHFSFIIPFEERDEIASLIREKAMYEGEFV